MNSLGLAKKGIAITLMLSGFALMGTGYGHLNDTLDIDEVLNTGNVALEYVGLFTNDDGLTTGGSVDLDDDGGPVASFDLHGASSSADPKAPGPQETSDATSFTERYDADVARCSASQGRSGSRAKVLIENAYPGYWCTAWLDVRNSGGIPVKVKSIRLVSGGTVTLVHTQPVALDLDNSGHGDIELEVNGMSLCQQVDPGDTVRIVIHHRVLAEASQSSTLAYGVEVAFQQSSALSDVSADGECQPAGTTLD